MCYHAANGTPIQNKGKNDLRGLTDEWQPISMTMQVCDVNRPLGSVRRICEAGNTVIVDDDFSRIVNKRTGSITPIERKSNGVYVLDMWIPSRKEDPNPKEVPPPPGFARPGSHP